MSVSEAAPVLGEGARHRRKWRNYLLDVGLQIRYTAFIIMLAVFLTCVLGYNIYDATRVTSKIILMTGLVDPTSASELQAQFRSNDRTVLFGIVGFGVILIMSVAGAGIWITHKVAGPLFNIGTVCNRIRDNKLGLTLRQLRKGDELQEFYSNFREMYEAVRGRVDEDIRLLGQAIAALEASQSRPPAQDELLAHLRELKRSKEESLQA